MRAQELNIDVLSNNMANVNTTGYKRGRAEFADLFYDARMRPGAPSADGTALPTGLEVGQGVRSVATYKDFNTGELRETGNSLDMALEGRGFFMVTQPDGEIAYSRSGTFKTNAEGQLVNTDGYAMSPEISIPADATSISISETGQVSVTIAGDSTQVEVGQIQLANFPNEAGLSSVGRNLYVETPASGTAVQTNPGEEGAGRVMQGFLESSNVSVVSEMIDLISAQRAYEINSKVISAADEMLRNVSKLG
jgi:flagellar basal-body rod protein FlgG